MLVIVITVHFANNRATLLAGCLLVAGLLGRLAIELSIKADETEAEFNKKLEKLQLINQLSCLIACGGLIIASCIKNAIIGPEGFNPYAQTEGERRSS